MLVYSWLDRPGWISSSVLYLAANGILWAILIRSMIVAVDPSDLGYLAMLAFIDVVWGYRLLQHLVNTTSIQIIAKTMIIRVGPIPWNRMFSLPPTELVQVQIDGRDVSNIAGEPGNIRRWMYKVNLRRKDGGKIVLAKDIASFSAALRVRTMIAEYISHKVYEAGCHATP